MAWPFTRSAPVALNIDQAEEQKAATSASGGVIQLQIARDPAPWQGTEPARLLKDGFSVNAAVYGCVMGWARPAAGLCWYLVRKPRSRGAKPQKFYSFAAAAKAMATDAGRKAVDNAEIEDHPVLRLFERPNPVMSGSEFTEAQVAYLLSTGNDYQYGVRSAVDGRVIEVWVQRPDRMRVVPGVHRVPAGYLELQPGGGTPVPFTVDEVSHLRLFSPLDEWYGMSPLRVAARSVDSDNEAMRWSYALLRNDMRPPGAFVSKDPLSDQSFQRLKKEMREKYQGATGAGRPLVLDNGLEWVSFAMTPAEVDWIQSRKDWFGDICTAFNYPKELLAKGAEVTYANRREALRAHYTENVIPLAEKLRERRNATIVASYGDDLYLDFDRDQIEALQEDREKLWARVDASSELTLNEKREAKGYEAINGGDVILVSSGDVPLDMVGELVEAQLNPPEPAIEGEVVDGKKPKALPKGKPEAPEKTERKALQRLQGVIQRLQ
ncbi:MAG: phage portal protein [Vicinamibacterales bacterium]